MNTAGRACALQSEPLYLN